MEPTRLHLPPTGPDAQRDEVAAARKAAQGLESFLLRRMLAEMRGSLGGAGEGGLLDGGFAGSTFREMFDEALADRIAGAGGIGLAPIFERELRGKQGPAVHAPADHPSHPARPAAAAPSASRAERAYRAAGSVQLAPPPPEDPGVVLPDLSAATGAPRR